MYYSVSKPCRVFSFGGDSLAWVDLRYGILLCNELDKDHVMRFIELPALMPTNFHLMGFVQMVATLFWIILGMLPTTYNNGCFRFVELELVDRSTSHPNCKLTMFEILLLQRIGSGAAQLALHIIGMY